VTENTRTLRDGLHVQGIIDTENVLSKVLLSE